MSVQWSLDDEVEKNKLNSTSVRKGTTSEISGLSSNEINPGDVIVNTSKNILVLNVGTSGDPHWVSDLLPLGTIRKWPGPSADIPNGWKRCNGSSYSKTTYADAYVKIGDSFGSTASTFNVPDMESDNRFVMGADGDDELGDTGGAEEHTLTIEEMPRHRHTFDNPSSSNSGSNASPRARVDQDSGSSGSGNAHNNLPPYRMFYRIIKLERS